MADNFNTELEELTKQFFFIMKDTLPKMEELSKIVPDLKDLPSQMNALSTKINDFQQEMTEKINTINETLETHSGQIDYVVGGIVAFNSVISDVRNQIDRVEKNCNNLTTRVDTISENCDSMAAKLTEMEKTVNKISDDTVVLSGQITVTDNNLSNLSTHVVGIDGMLEFLNSGYEKINKSLSSLDEQMTTVNGNISTVQGDVSNLTTKMEECSKNCKSIGDAVTNITDVVIPALEEKIDNAGGGGGGGQENWLPIFDKDSEDPKINWGRPTGILGGAGDLSAVSPDFAPYKKLKVYFTAMGTRHAIIFDTDIDSEMYQYYACVVIKHALDSITGASFCLIQQSDGSRYFFMQDIVNYKFNTNGTAPTKTIVDNNEKYCFERIYGLL